MKNVFKSFGSRHVALFLIITFAAVIVLGLTGCGSSPAPAPAAAAPVTPPPATEAPPPPPPASEAPPPAASARLAYEDYFGTWAATDGSGWTVAANDSQLRFTRNGQEYFVISDLRWTERTNTISTHRNNYPTGYAISGRVSEITGTFFISGTHASLGSGVTIYYFFGPNANSIMGGNREGVPANEVVYRRR